MNILFTIIIFNRKFFSIVVTNVSECLIHSSPVSCIKSQRGNKSLFNTLLWVELCPSGVHTLESWPLVPQNMTSSAVRVVADIIS